jgi:hypothetical protein
MDLDIDLRRAAVANRGNVFAIRLADGVAMFGQHADQSSRLIGAVAGYKLDQAALVAGDERP